MDFDKNSSNLHNQDRQKVHQTSIAPSHKTTQTNQWQVQKHLWAGIQTFWFGVIRLSRIAPAHRRKATVNLGSKLTVTGTLKFTGSAIFSLDGK